MLLNENADTNNLTQYDNLDLTLLIDHGEGLLHENLSNVSLGLQQCLSTNIINANGRINK